MRPTLSRRRFLTLTAAGSAGLAFGLPRPGGAEVSLAVKEAWAGFATLGENVWAVASTPMESNDWRTGANGGLVAGAERVLAIESFVETRGAAWVAEVAKELTGRRPTDVLISHFHGDHANGLAGYAEGGDAPQLWVTRTTLDLINEADAQRDAPEDPVRRAMLEAAKIIDASGATDLDLGGRKVAIHPRRGHTPSDVTVEIEDPSIVFGGDLLWNGFFPNYRDTIPSPFSASVRAARRERETIYVPGHGALADGAATGQLLTLLDAVETAGRAAHEKGMSAADAAKDFSLPEEVSDWVLFNERYFEVAIGRWLMELGGEIS